MLEILWESATKFRKETVYVCSDIFLLVKKNVFPLPSRLFLYFFI